MRNSIRENKKCMRDGELHASGYKAAANWWGLGKKRAPVGRTSRDGLLQGFGNGAVKGGCWLLKGLPERPGAVRQLPPQGNKWNKKPKVQPSQLRLSHNGLVAHGTVKLWFLASHPNVPGFPAVWGGLRRRTSPQCMGTALAMQAGCPEHLDRVCWNLSRLPQA